ncbi:hypothetical protein F5Y18DRAFT_428472 [Xylariaceae sp. FL1019]|nr:hypothetical protein F5Y18DRAFT_428472 [Xylariaceae sp. FL1019]
MAYRGALFSNPELSQSVDVRRASLQERTRPKRAAGSSKHPITQPEQGLAWQTSTRIEGDDAETPVAKRRKMAEDVVKNSFAHHLGLPMENAIPWEQRKRLRDTDGQHANEEAEYDTDDLDFDSENTDDFVIWTMRKTLT